VVVCWKRGNAEREQEVNVGLAADIGTLQRLPKIVGNASKVRELALTGRKFGAEEAMQMGFVSEVVRGGREEVMSRALEMGRVMAAKSPVAVVGTKHLLNRMVVSVPE
jgi:delta(3,5)-delta(2,4)-dienoyl-CoA isomerase